MATTVLLLSFASEQLLDLHNSPYFQSWIHTCASLGIISGLGILAFLMVWTEFKVIAETSALTFMVAGTCKEVVTGEWAFESLCLLMTNTGLRWTLQRSACWPLSFPGSCRMDLSLLWIPLYLASVRSYCCCWWRCLLSSWHSSPCTIFWLEKRPRQRMIRTRPKMAIWNDLAVSQIAHYAWFPSRMCSPTVCSLVRSNTHRRKIVPVCWNTETGSRKRWDQ